VFTARYALSPYIKQIRFVFKGLINNASIHATERYFQWLVTACAYELLQFPGFPSQEVLRQCSRFTGNPSVTCHVPRVHPATLFLWLLILTLFTVWNCVCGTGSLSGIPTHYGLDSPGIESWFGQDFPLPSRPALESTRPNGYRISFPRVKWPGRGVDHRPPYSTEVKEGVKRCSTLFLGLHKLF
jgi:hypothetical protein